MYERNRNWINKQYQLNKQVQYSQIEKLEPGPEAKKRFARKAYALTKKTDANFVREIGRKRKGR